MSLQKTMKISPNPSLPKRGTKISPFAKGGIINSPFSKGRFCFLAPSVNVASTFFPLQQMSLLLSSPFSKCRFYFLSPSAKVASTFFPL
jgi:hypothetical protein